MNEKQPSTIRFGSRAHKARQESASRWRVTVTLPSEKRRNIYAGTLAELQLKADELWGLERTDTLRWFFFNVYLPSIAHTSHASKRKIADGWDLLIGPRFGSWAIKDITRAEIQKAVNEWAAERIPIDGKNRRGKPLAKAGRLRFSPGGLKTRIQGFSSILALAATDGIIPSNPAGDRQIRLPKPAPSLGSSLTPEVAQRGVSHEDRTTRQLARLFLLGIGVEEAIHLTRASLETGEGWIKITQGVKNDYRRREIPIPPSLAKEIDQDAGEFFLVTSQQGKQLTAKGVPHYLQRAGLPPMRQWRKFFASVIENEIEAPRPVVQTLMGHADGVMLGRYSKARKAQLRKWVDRYLDWVSGVAQEFALHGAGNESEKAV